MNYIDRLISNCLEAKSATPIREFVMGDISELKGINKAIYVIEQISGDPELAIQELTSFKKKKERACPAINSASKIMYVGSSTTGVEKRIKQPLGNGP